MKTLTILGALTAIVAVAAPQAVAQRGGGGPMVGPRTGMAGMPMGGRASGAEMALQMRERLELTEEQINQLNQIRVQSLEQRQRQMAEMLDVQSRFRAGEATGDAVRQVLESQRDTRQEAMEAEREQVAGLLTEAQQEVFGQARERGPRMGQRHRGLRGGPRGSRRGWR